MAININLLPLLAALPTNGGRVLTFGNQRANITTEQLANLLKTSVLEADVCQTDVFRALGFQACESLDISDYEGSEHVFDLNEPEAPEGLLRAYDFVLTGGTLEHVFHVSRALQHAASFVRPGGLLVHIGPANNWINHGFYQICPGLLLDYLDANGWGLLQSALIDVMDAPRGVHHWRVKPGTHQTRHEGKRQQYFCAARRVEGATTDRVPKQRAYQIKHDKKQATEPSVSFEPFDIRNGRSEHC